MSMFGKFIEVAEGSDEEIIEGGTLWYCGINIVVLKRLDI